MYRRTVGLAALGLVTAGFAVAVTIPAGAASTPAPVASDGAFVAMQRDLKLSPAQARTRLAAEAAAARTDSSLRAELGPRFAGSWLDAEGNTLTVAVTDDAAAEQVRAAGAAPLVVARSAAQLDRVKTKLDQAAAQAPDVVSSWYVDEPTNTVVVTTSSLKAAERFVAASGLHAADVRIVESAEVPRPLHDVRGGESFFINSARCSVGLSVAGGFVTAGHCGTAGATATGFNLVGMGSFAGSSFPGDDYAFVTTNTDWTPQPWVEGASGENVLVAGSQETPVGGTICRSGSTTGWHCGVVQEKDVTVNYSQGQVAGLTKTDVCSERGDSGGAWMSGNQAQGVTSGGAGNCTDGGTTYFQPLAEILSVYGLTLTTSGGAPPKPASTTGENLPNAAPFNSAQPVTTWQGGTDYKAGRIVTYDGVRYLSRTPHHARSGWEPLNAPALWTRL